MRKRSLSAVVALGMFSNLALCTASAGTENNESAVLGSKVARVAMSHPSKIKGKAKSSKGSGRDVGLIEKTFMMATFYGGLTRLFLQIFSDAGYIDKGKFQENYGKVKDLAETLLDPKSGKMARTKSVLKNSKAIEASYGFVSRATPFYTAGKVVGKVGSYVLGVPDVGGLVGLGMAAYTSLTATGKSFRKSLLEPGLEWVADVLPEDEEQTGQAKN